MKKITVTVSWARTVELEIDETRVGDEAYLDEIRNKSIEQAGADLNWKDGIVTDSDEPALIE